MNRKTFFFVLLLNLLCILSSNAQETSYDLYEKVTRVEENERYHLIAECDGKFYCAQNVLKSASLGSDEITIDKNGQFYYGPLGKNGFEFFQLIKVRGEIQRWKSALIICRYLL